MVGADGCMMGVSRTLWLLAPATTELQRICAGCFKQ